MNCSRYVKNNICGSVWHPESLVVAETQHSLHRISCPIVSPFSSLRSVLVTMRFCLLFFLRLCKRSSWSPLVNWTNVVDQMRTHPRDGLKAILISGLCFLNKLTTTFHDLRCGSRILKWGVNFCNNVIEPKPGWGVWGLCINIWGIRKTKKRRGLRKRGVKIQPFHLPWIHAWICLTKLVDSMLPYVCDLLLNTPTSTWNLFVLYNDQIKRPMQIPASYTKATVVKISFSLGNLKLSRTLFVFISPFLIFVNDSL